MSFRRLYLFAALLLPLQFVWALTYTPRYEIAEWRSEGDVFSCRLWQPIDQFGDAVFSRQAGLSQEFYLSSKLVRMAAGKANLVVASPSWKPYSPDEILSPVGVRSSRKPIRLNKALSTRLMDELFDGKEPTFTRRPWYNKTDTVDVAVSPIKFRSAYREYQNCVAALLPVNYDQIKRSAVFFSSSRWAFPGGQRLKMDNIATYVVADETIQTVYIDGHTDSQGLRTENYVLARQRAEQVANYLIDRGVPEEKLKVRWHGERYPVGSNRTIKGRGKNRRVTVRLERNKPVSFTQADSANEQ